MMENISKLYDVGVRLADSIVSPLKAAHAQIGPVYDGADSVKETLCDRLGDYHTSRAIDDFKEYIESDIAEGLTHTGGYQEAVETLQELEACSGYGSKVLERITDVSGSDPTGIILGVVGVIGAGIGGMVLYSRSKNKTSSQKHYGASETSSAI